MSPGRFFTPEARHQRQSAQREIRRRSREMIEYSPAGKGQMVLGGFGTVRLGAKQIRGEMMYLLGASSSADAHKGIVVACSERQYQQIIDTIKHHGGCFANLLGSVQILPKERSIVSPLSFDPGLPRHCVVLEDFELLEPAPVLASAVVLYSTVQDQEHLKSWSFCSFTTDYREAGLRTAVDWL